MGCVQSAERAQELNLLLLGVRREQRSAEYRLAKWLAELADQRHFQQLGYSTLCHYADTVLGLGSRQTRALCALGRGLADLPALDAAFEAGELGWTKAREVLRVATPETDDLWVDFALSTNSRVLERAVSMTTRGDPPPIAEPEVRGAARRRLVFELEGKPPSGAVRGRARGEVGALRYAAWRRPCSSGAPSSRLLHDGRLAVERLADGTLEFRFADGRCIRSDPRGAETKPPAAVSWGSTVGEMSLETPDRPSLHRRRSSWPTDSKPETHFCPADMAEAALTESRVAGCAANEAWSSTKAG